MAQSRRSRHIIRRIDPMSVAKFSVVLYLCLYVVLLVAGVVLWLLATISGIRENIESFVADLGFEGFHLVGSAVLQASAIGGALLVVVGTGVNVLMSVLYNLISDVVGGVSVTLEDPGAPDRRTHAGSRPDRRLRVGSRARSGTAGRGR